MDTHDQERSGPGRIAIGSIVIATTLAGGIAVGSGQALAATSIVAAYEMDESSSASVLHDSGPYGLHGTIGDDVMTGVDYDGATGYRWRFTPPNAPPAMPERIVNVPSSPALNPDGQDYAVEFRYRTTQNFGNVVQKGQNKTWGGYFKFEQPNGRMTCLFKGGNGRQRAVRSPIETNDGEWHVIRCERSSWGIRLYVDGVKVRQLRGSTGTISNDKPLSIGGKSVCDQGEVTCDYFTGEIDYVRIEKEGSTPPPPPPPPPPVNEAPVASFTMSCDDLACSPDPSASHDDDGEVVDWVWTFGDGSSASGSDVSHTYDAPGSYLVTLTVTDDDGAVATTQRSAVVGSIASEISHVGSETRSGWSRRPHVELPTVQSGDRILLFMTVPSNATIGEPDGGGWEPITAVSGSKGTTRVWQKLASAGDSGDDVSVTASKGTKYNASAIAYRGVGGVSAAAGEVNTVYTDVRVTPEVEVADPGSWGVSFWMHRDSDTSSFDAPDGVIERVARSQSGGGRATVLIADSGGGVAGDYGGLAAIAETPSTYGITISLVLQPG